MDIVLILLLILLNGVFAMSEIAVVSSRKSRLQNLADDGSLGAEAALRLHQEPASFLSTIQVGITLVGILNGAVGEAAIADPLAFEAEVSQWPGVVTVGVFARNKAQVCLLGGAAGVLLSLLIGVLFEHFSSQFSLSYSLDAVLMAFFCSSLIGVLFGFLPARNAAQLDPIEALARE